MHPQQLSMSLIITTEISCTRFVVTPGLIGSPNLFTSTVRPVDSQVLASRYVHLPSSSTICSGHHHIESWTRKRPPFQPHPGSLHLEEAQHSQPSQVPMSASIIQELYYLFSVLCCVMPAKNISHVNSRYTAWFMFTTRYFSYVPSEVD